MNCPLTRKEAYVEALKGKKVYRSPIFVGWFMDAEFKPNGDVEFYFNSKNVREPVASCMSCVTGYFVKEGE